MKTFEALIYNRSSNDDLGLDMFFYNLSTALIYQYELIYQMVDGKWSNDRFSDRSLWSSANIYLTIYKPNARTQIVGKINKDVLYPNRYNLKSILNIPSAKERVILIGKVANSGIDANDAMALLNEGFHECYDMIGDDSYESYNDFMSDIINSEYRNLGMMIDYDRYNRIVNAKYSEKEAKDDLGMIQNTMRNIL